MYRTTAIAIVSFFFLAQPLSAQNVSFTLAPSPKNHVACATANGTFARKWSVVEAGASAAVTGAAALTLRKGSDGVFGGTARVVNSVMTFTFVNNGQERILKVTSRELACVWQGTNLDPRRS